MLLAWSDTLTTGTFALVGVLIGAIVGAVVQAVFEWRRNAGELRQAKRQIAEDMLRVGMHYEGMAQSRSTPRKLGGGEATFLPSGAWATYGPNLARLWGKRRDNDYEALSNFVGTLPVMRDLLAELPANTPLSGELWVRVQEGFEQAAGCYTILTGKPFPAADE